MGRMLWGDKQSLIANPYTTKKKKKILGRSSVICSYWPVQTANVSTRLDWLQLLAEDRNEAELIFGLRSSFPGHEY